MLVCSKNIRSTIDNEKITYITKHIQTIIYCKEDKATLVAIACNGLNPDEI